MLLGHFSFHREEARLGDSWRVVACRGLALEMGTWHICVEDMYVTAVGHKLTDWSSSGCSWVQKLWSHVHYFYSNIPKVAWQLSIIHRARPWDRSTLRFSAHIRSTRSTQMRNRRGRARAEQHVLLLASLVGCHIACLSSSEPSKLRPAPGQPFLPNLAQTFSKEGLCT